MLLGFASAMLIFLNPVSASAPQEGRVSARPSKYDPGNPKTQSWFIYELKPGESQEDSITIMNLTEETIYIKVYPVDATTTQEGFFALIGEDEKQNEVGTWIKMKSNVVTVGPHEYKDVPFTITIPKYTTIGDHPGGIVVQEVEKPNPKKSGIGLNIISRMGVRVYESVPGDKIANMDMSNFAYRLDNDHLVYTFTLENLGNIILDPNGMIQLKDQDGKIVDTIHMPNLGSVFPHKPTFYTFKSDKERPLFGQFTATVTVNYAVTKAISRSLNIILYLKNWEYLIAIPLIILILALIITFTIKRLRHRKKWYEKHSPAGHPAPSSPAHTPPSLSPIPYPLSPNADLSLNVDQLFIAKHIRLVIFLIPTSVILFSCIFAVMLYLFAISHNTQLPFNPAIFAPSNNQIITNPSPTLSPIPYNLSPTINKSSMQINVLNGSGIVGAAKKISDKLSANGFTVVKYDNAPEGKTQTIISYPSGKINGAEQLEEQLKPQYSNINLEESSTSAQFTIILVN